MQGRSRGGHQPSFSGSISRATQLANAYQELGKQLDSKELRQVGNYSLGRVIGEGTFGKVRLALHRLTSTRCAIKQIPRHLAPSALTREIHHHRRLHHPHVVQLYEVLATEQHIWLVSELCPGGELFDYLVEHGRLTETETRKIFGQLCLALAYIHAQGVVHRDLKLENVLLDERCNVKVADFGFGREFEQRKLMETFCGSVGYSAPEMLAGRKYTGEEVDLWSLGIILYTLLCGSLPFDDDDEHAMKAKIMKGFYELPDFLSSEASELISAILQLNPSDRLSIKQILSHPWFTKPPPDPAMDALPSMIPEDHETSEEPDSVSQAVPENAPIEPARSDSSHHSPRSSESSLSRSHNSRETTPVTSEDEADHGPSLDVVASELAKVSPLQRQSSDATLTQGHESDETSGGRTNSFRSTLPTHAEHEGGSPERRRPFRFPSGLALVNNLPLTNDMMPPASPMLPTHSRTPARTKRRSVSSTFSERLLTPLEAGVPDFLALLSEPIVEPLSTSSEKALLSSLASLGFDTGQMTHSIKTHACDASGATWWLLKRKSDERDAEARELAASRSPSSDTFRRNRASATPTIMSRHTPRLQDPLTRLEMDSRAASSMDSPASSLTSSPTHGRQPSFFAPQPTLPASASSPLLSSDPPRTGALSPRASTGNMPTIVASPSLQDELRAEADGEPAKTKNKARSSSVSMLSRAFSSSAGAPEGRSTPTSQFVGLFTRKSMGALSAERGKDKPKNASTDALSVSQPASSATTPSRSASHTPVGSPALEGSPWFDISPGPATRQLPQTSPELKRVEVASGKGRNRGSLFSNFKLWFNEDRKKRKRGPSTLSPASIKVRPHSRTSMDRGGLSPIYGTNMTPRRPSAPIQRTSSHTTTTGVSRRPSYASGHGRSGSASGASLGTGSPPPSRPSSVAGSTGKSAARMNRHYKSGSQSSAGSKRSALGSPAPPYRRPPTQTHVQVRRVSGNAAAVRRRPHSSASSVRSASSRRSSMSDDGFGHEDLQLAHRDAPPIAEEPEHTGELVDADRQAALRKLSGEYPRPTLAKIGKRASDDSTASSNRHSIAHRSSSGSHAAPTTILTARKTTHVFGGPHQQRSSAKPKYRDVFARSPTGDDEWQDEPEDHLSGFSRGFGQAAEGSTASSSKAAGPLLGEGRYAGVMPSEDGAPWRPQAKSAGPALRAAVIEEDEEEDM